MIYPSESNNVKIAPARSRTSSPLKDENVQAVKDNLKQQLHCLVYRWAEARGRRGNYSGPSSDAAKLLDRQLITQFQNIAAAQRWDFEPYKLLLKAQYYYDRGRLAAIQQHVVQAGQQLGLQQQRVTDPAGIRRLDRQNQAALRSISKYLKNQEVLTRYSSGSSETRLVTRMKKIFKLAFEAGLEQRAQAEQLAVKLHDRLIGHLGQRHYFGWIDCLTGKDNQIIAEIAAIPGELRYLVCHSFSERYQVSAIEAARTGLIGASAEQAVALLSGDCYKAALTGVKRALLRVRFSTNPNRLLHELQNALEPLEQLGSKERETAYRRLVPNLDSICRQSWAKESLESALERVVGGAEVDSSTLKCAKALLQGESLKADTFLLLRMLTEKRVNPQAICKLLEKHPADRLASAYKQAHPQGEGLASSLTARLPSGAILDLAVALISADSGAAVAARIRCGFEKLSGYWPGTYFLKSSARKRDYIMKAYLRHYRPDLLPQLSDQRESLLEAFGRSLAQSFDKFEAEIILDLARYGSVKLSKLFYFCVRGVGCDIEGLRSLLNYTSVAQLQKASEQYHCLWQQQTHFLLRPFGLILGNLSRRILWEVKGDNWFDLSQLFKGRPKEASLLEQRMLAFYRHENSGTLLRKIRRISNEEAVLKNDIRAAQGYYKKNLLHLQSNPTTSHLLRFKYLVKMAEVSCAAFRDCKYLLGRQITRISAAATVVTAGAAVYWMPNYLAVGALVFVVSVCTRFACKKLIQGDGYSVSSFEALSDAGCAAVDGLSPIFLLAYNAFFFRKLGVLASALGVDAGIRALTRWTNKNGISQLGLKASELAGLDDKSRYQELERKLIKYEQLLANSTRDDSAENSFFQMQYELWQLWRAAKKATAF